jgi:YjbR protein
LEWREHGVTAADFRRIALALPEAVEGSHFGSADFRVGGKIFATLALESEGYGVLLLTPEQQAGMVEDEPRIFSPVPGVAVGLQAGTVGEGGARHTGRGIANGVAKKSAEAPSAPEISALTLGP